MRESLSDCSVYNISAVTVSFEQIKDSHIGNSRDCSFEQLVMMETDGRGVDLVLNSLAEEKLLASVRCLAKGGRFLEIGKFDLANNNPLGEQSTRCIKSQFKQYHLMQPSSFTIKPTHEQRKPAYELISTIEHHYLRNKCT